MSEDDAIKVIRSFPRPVMLAELMETFKACNEEITRSISELCKDQKLFMKDLTSNISIVWENKYVHGNTTSQKLLHIPFSSSSALHNSCESLEEIVADVKIAKEKLYNLECQLQMFSNKDDRLQFYISKLHEYNEIKDTGITLIGKLAEVEFLTTADLYEIFGLQIED